MAYFNTAVLQLPFLFLPVLFERLTQYGKQQNTILYANIIDFIKCLPMRDGFCFSVLQSVFVACGHVVQIGGIKRFILLIFYYFFFFGWVLIHGLSQTLGKTVKDTAVVWYSQKHTVERT